MIDLYVCMFSRELFVEALGGVRHQVTPRGLRPVGDDEWCDLCAELVEYVRCIDAARLPAVMASAVWHVPLN